MAFEVVALLQQVAEVRRLDSGPLTYQNRNGHLLSVFRKYDRKSFHGQHVLGPDF
jgi:hypothetical protein